MRKSLLKGLSIITLSLIVLTGCGGQASQGTTKSIVVNSAGGVFGDALREGYFKSFTADTGIKVVETSPTDFGKLKAMVESGNVEWDLTEITAQDYLVAIKHDLLETIDYTNIDTRNFVDRENTAKDKVIGQAYYSTILAYRTDAFKGGKVPQSVTDIWDVKNFPGPRALRNDPVNNLEFALLADGVPIDELYPLDVDRAFKKLDEIKPHVTVWWKTGAQSAQLLVDNEVVMGTAWNGRIDAIKNDGAPVEMVWDKAQLHLNYFAIPKGAKHKKEAEQLLKYFAGAEGQAKQAEIAKYTAPNEKLFDFIDSEVAKNLPTSPENYDKQILIDEKWWAENREAVTERWNKWMLDK